ncbi:MAG: heme ABC transporter ATP-binding protein, partial [Chloroflexota bacterium]
PGRRYTHGQDITDVPPRKVIESGVAHVPEDRQKNGMVADFPITDNMILQTYHKRPFSQGLIRQERPIEENADEQVGKFDVRTPSIHANIGTLSGGNQQKAIIAREFSRDSKLLIVAQPTRGVDVGSIEFIHKQIVKMRDAGTAVLLVTTELDEILSLSDRVVVMYAGSVAGTLDISEADRETVGLLMAGITDKAKTEGEVV